MLLCTVVLRIRSSSYWLWLVCPLLSIEFVVVVVMGLIVIEVVVVIKVVEITILVVGVVTTTTIITITVLTHGIVSFLLKEPLTIRGFMQTIDITMDFTTTEPT